MRKKEFTAKDELFMFIMNLTPEQADKIVKRMDMLKQLVTLNDNQLIYSEEFLKRLFGKVKE